LSSAFAQALAYVDAQQLAALQLQPDAHVLGAIGHGERNEAPSSMVCAWTGLVTHPPGPRFEVWSSRAPVAIETHDSIRCARNDEVLFGFIEFDPGNAGQFQRRALEHYAKVFAVIDAYGYPHLLRIWHYLPQIHLEEDGLERYRRFSVARHDAFLGSGRDIARDAPAASAVGKREGTAVFAFLAGKRRGTPIENPRQTSAYRYPVQYGPRGPTFARAACVTWGQQDQLYVSGTASIVGHESRHAGSARSQTEETIRNLCALLDESRACAPAGTPEWQRLLFKVYLRPGVAQDPVLESLRNTFGDEPDVLVLEADICRQELLVEIEAVALRASA
jgi:chorismate lyase/3-hydroxybenzoate synthase